MLFLLPIAFVLPSLLQSASATDCSCYRTSSKSYFTDYKFYDFRTHSGPLPPVPQLPDVLPKDKAPTKSEYSSEPRIGVAQEGFMKSPEWTGDWSVQDWGKEPTSEFPIKMQNSLSNVYLVSNDTQNTTSKLVMRTHRFDQFQSSAEVESMTKNVLYASVRIRARVFGAPGGVAGLFLYMNTQNESDIEILTRDTQTQIRYTNQPVLNDEGDEIKDASTEVNMTTKEQIDGTQSYKLKERGAARTPIHYDTWHTHRIDWVAGKSSWFVDGEHFLDKKYGVPTVPSYFVMNMWSDGGVWSGNMTTGQSAYMEIEYIEMVYNISGLDVRDAQPKCNKVCVVDSVSVTGVPEPAKGDAAKRSLNPRSLGMAILVMGMLSF